jgi:hypothetical protein
MRCRKVRSYLSAFCNGEINGSVKILIDEHLSGCTDCRKEEEIYKSLILVKPVLSDMKVSNEFNNNILNRIAHERFNETRTKAYFPKRAPRLIWSKAIPVAVTACLILAFGIMNITFDNSTIVPNLTNNQSGLDDSYLTVQPTENPNMTIRMNKDWSFEQILARTERINQISKSMTPVGSFSSSGTQLTGVKRNIQAPYDVHYFRYRPVIKIYGAPQPNPIKEGSGDY